MSPNDLQVAQYFRHLATHEYDENCTGCEGGLNIFEKLMRRARPASVGFAVSVWAPVLDEDRKSQADPGWAVQWARCVEWEKARNAFDSLSGLEFVTGVAQWATMSESERLEKREVGLFLDAVSHYGHVDRFQLAIAYRKADA